MRRAPRPGRSARRPAAAVAVDRGAPPRRSHASALARARSRRERAPRARRRRRRARLRRPGGRRVSSPAPTPTGRSPTLWRRPTPSSRAAAARRCWTRSPRAQPPPAGPRSGAARGRAARGALARASDRAARSPASSARPRRRPSSRFTDEERSRRSSATPAGCPTASWPSTRAAARPPRTGRSSASSRRRARCGSGEPWLLVAGPAERDVEPPDGAVRRSRLAAAPAGRGARARGARPRQRLRRLAPRGRGRRADARALRPDRPGAVGAGRSARGDARQRETARSTRWSVDAVVAAGRALRSAASGPPSG